MRTIKCARCGAIISASGTKYLCDGCAAQARRESVLRPRTCRTCGAQFIGGPRAWYCPSCRSDRQKAQQKNRKQTARPLGSTDICERCGGEYIVNSARQRYCPACREAAMAENVRSHKRQYNVEHAADIRARKSDAARNRKICAVCGNPFYSGTNAATCSSECARMLRKYQWAEADYKRGRRKMPPELPQNKNKAQS